MIYLINVATPTQDDIFKINTAEIFNTIANTPSVKEFADVYMVNPQNRITQIKLVPFLQYDSINATQNPPTEYLIQIEIIERDDHGTLNIIHATANPLTRKIVSVNTYRVPEKEYAYNTCKTTVCHN